MSKLRSDIAYAFRSIRQNRLLSAFTFVIAAVTAILLNVVLQMAEIVYGDNPPFLNAGRTVSFLSSDFKDKDGRYVDGITAGYIPGFIKRIHNLEKVCVSNTESVMVLSGDNVVPAYASFVSGQYWDMNDFDFTEGRGFTEDESSEAARTAVVTDEFAERIIGKGTAAGREIKVQGIDYEIIGVVKNYSSFATAKEHTDVWLTNGNTKFLPSGDPYYVLDIQFREEVPEAEFRRDLYMALKGFYDDRNIDLDLEEEDIKTVKEKRMEVFGDSGGAFIGLGIIIVLLLLIPVVNIVSLNESGIQGRMSELSVRRAIGATRADIVRLVMSENLLIVFAGTATGLFLTRAVVGAVEKVFLESGGMEVTVLAGPVDMMTVIAVFLYAIFFSVLSTGIPVLLSMKKCIAALMKGGDYVR